MNRCSSNPHRRARAAVGPRTTARGRRGRSCSSLCKPAALEDFRDALIDAANRADFDVVTAAIADLSAAAGSWHLTARSWVGRAENSVAIARQYVGSPARSHELLLQDGLRSAGGCVMTGWEILTGVHLEPMWRTQEVVTSIRESLTSTAAAAAQLHDDTRRLAVMAVRTGALSEVRAAEVVGVSRSTLRKWLGK